MTDILKEVAEKDGSSSTPRVLDLTPRWTKFQAEAKKISSLAQLGFGGFLKPWLLTLNENIVPPSGLVFLEKAKRLEPCPL